MYRLVGLLIAALPLVLVAALGVSGWRIADGRWATPGYVLFGLSALVCFANFYLSFLRYPIHRALGGTLETYRWVSGIPMVGSLIVPSLSLLPPAGSSVALTFFLLAIDTGGVPWLVLGTWNDESFWGESEDR